MPTFKDYFNFTKEEIACAFAHAHQEKYFQGLKMLHASIECSNLIKSFASPYGKLLVITPRSCGKAHERNLIKRRTKAIFYEHKLYQNQGLWILLIRKQAMLLPFEELKKYLISAIKHHD